MTTYVRDAQGNVLAVYQRTGSNALQKIESHIYDSSRIGIIGQETTVPTTVSLVSPYQPARLITFTRGEKAYELTNHLGNVLVTISDKKLAVVSSGAITSYNPDIVTASDYYPFGMQMPGRTFNASTYRYGFNGQEKDNDISGDGNTYTAEFWEYDYRIGRRWNEYPLDLHIQSTYVCFSNNPVYYVDPNGLYSSPEMAEKCVNEL